MQQNGNINEYNTLLIFITHLYTRAVRAIHNRKKQTKQNVIKGVKLNRLKIFYSFILTILYYFLKTKKEDHV